MRVLLDTHALVWWFENSQRLSKRAATIISNADHTVYVSAASAWEMAIKTNLGKFDALPVVIELSKYAAEEGFVELPISLEHATRAGFLPLHHCDPFDRLLVAQSQSLNIPIVSADALLDRYDVKRLW